MLLFIVSSAEFSVMPFSRVEGVSKRSDDVIKKQDEVNIVIVFGSNCHNKLLMHIL